MHLGRVDEYADVAAVVSSGGMGHVSNQYETYEEELPYGDAGGLRSMVR